MSVKFGPHPIPDSHVFWEGDHFCSIVNLKPITDGHVLLITRRQASRFGQLTDLELRELHEAASNISRTLMGGNSNIVVQDGSDAGQTVKHFHMHIVPRQSALEKVDNDTRISRSTLEMAAEASKYRNIVAKATGLARKLARFI